MNWRNVLCFVIVNSLAVVAMDLVHLKRMLDLIRGNFGRSRKAMYFVTGPEDLPGGSSHPGHTLLKPSNSTLESSAKYPHKNLGNLVYGNLGNLGITYNKTNERITYSGFRRNADLLEQLLGTIEKKPKIRQEQKKLPTIILIKDMNVRPQPLVNYASINAGNQISDYESSQDSGDSSDRENDAREMLDIIKPSNSHGEFFETRRRNEIKHTNRKEHYETDEDDVSHDSDSSSSDHEKNPGNPFTVHKNRYKQNWLWNHAMTGNHINVNPKAPVFSNQGPSGAELFFGRKWWYYNQDDYVPFR